MTPLAETPRERNNRISLQEYFEAMFAQYKESHEREHVLLAKSVEHAKEAMNMRLEAMNQFRQQIQTERGSMLTCDKFETKHQALEMLVAARAKLAEDRVNVLEVQLSNLKGRMGAIAAAISVGLVIFELVMRFVVR
jgi:deoxyribodipyrimidine photolyase-like uncharacterized protein